MIVIIINLQTQLIGPSSYPYRTQQLFLVPPRTFLSTIEVYPQFMTTFPDWELIFHVTYLSVLSSHPAHHQFISTLSFSQSHKFFFALQQGGRRNIAGKHLTELQRLVEEMLPQWGITFSAGKIVFLVSAKISLCIGNSSLKIIVCLKLEPFTNLLKASVNQINRQNGMYNT